MDPLFSALNQKALATEVPSSVANKPAKTENSPFDMMMGQNHQSGMNEELTKFVDGLFGNLNQQSSMQTYSASGVNMVSPSGEYGQVTEPGKNRFMGFLEDLNHSQFQMENLMERVSSGQQFSKADMIQAQMVTAEFTLGYELVGKGVENVMRAINTPFNMQIS